VVASYDPDTKKLTWGDPTQSNPGLADTGTVAPPTLGEESWKWLFLQPLTSQE
jgi:phospholipid/cholesterol/gamma-HCH transport system substrate-binding protein